MWENENADGDYPIKTRSFHGIVPETDTSTHYFHGGAAKDVANAGAPALTGNQAQNVLLEDVDVLESIQENERLVGDRSVINVRNDLAVMKWRSFLQEAAKRESVPPQ